MIEIPSSYKELYRWRKASYLDLDRLTASTVQEPKWGSSPTEEFEEQAGLLQDPWLRLVLQHNSPSSEDDYFLGKDSFD